MIRSSFPFTWRSIAPYRKTPFSLRACDFDRSDVRQLRAVRGALGRLPRKRVVAERRHDVERREFAAVGVHARRFHEPMFPVPGPRRFPEIAFAAEEPRAELVV